MPMIIPAVVAIAAAAAVTSVGVGLEIGLAASIAASIGIASEVGTMLFAGAVGMVLSTGVSMLIGAMTPTARPASLSAHMADQTSSYRGSIAPALAVYGRTLVGNVLVFMGSSGSSNEYLHMVMPLAWHPIAGVDAVWINETRIVPSDWDAGGNVVSGTLAGLVRVKIHMGDQTTADSDLLADMGSTWPSTAVGYGRPYVYVRLLSDRDRLNGWPSRFNCEVRGKNDILDPRTGARGYTDNLALIVLDYLTMSWGMAAATDEYDAANIIAQANICDEMVPMNAAATVLQARYTINGAFKLDEKRRDVLDKLLAAGAAVLTYVQGRHRLHVGAYEAPSDVLSPSDYAGDLVLDCDQAGRDVYNAIKGTYVSPVDGWQAMPFPAITSSTWEAEDGERIWTSIELAMVDEPTRAQRIALLLAKRARDGMRIRVPVKYSALRFSVMQTLAVTDPKFGWTSKPFLIEGWLFDPVSGVPHLVLNATSAASYAWTYDLAAAQPTTPRTTLVDPLTVPAPTGLALTASTAVQADGTVVPALVATWSAPAYPFTTGYEVRWRVAGSSNPWENTAASAPNTRALLVPVALGTAYEAQVRTTTALTRSNWSSLQAAGAVADTTAPAAPTGLSAAGVLRGIYLRWTRATATDLAATEVWESTDGGATYAQVGAIDTDAWLRGGLSPGDTARYKLRSRDRSGNVSGFSSVVGPVTVPTAATTDITPGAVSSTTTTTWSGSYPASPMASTAWTTVISMTVGEVGYAGELLVNYGIDGGSMSPDNDTYNNAALYLDGVFQGNALTREATKRAFAKVSISGLHTLTLMIQVTNFSSFYTVAITATSVTATFLKR